MEALQGEIAGFKLHLCQKMAFPVPTKSLLKMSPDAAKLFASFRYTHPPPPVLPFLLTQNLGPKDIAGSDIMKLKVS